MIRKFLAATGIAIVGLVAVPSAAYASYAPPEEPVIEVPVDEDSIDPGEQVPVLMDEFLPGSSAILTVSADGVEGADIGLTVLGSNSIQTTVDSDGSFEIGVVFPQPAVYTLSASGLDEDGNPKTVSLTLEVSTAGSGGDGGGDGGGDDGLPNTGSSSFGGLLAGAGLVALGAGVIVMSRRRSRDLVDTDA